jgi:hypothetical protein
MMDIVGVGLIKQHPLLLQNFKKMIKRLLHFIGFICYLLIVLVPLFFPYLVVRGYKKTEKEILMPFFYFLEGMA